MGLLDGVKKKRAMEKLYQARIALPLQSLTLYQDASKLFDEIGDQLNSRKALGGYHKALGRALLRQGKFDEAIKVLKTARWIFTNLGEWEEVSTLKADIADAYVKKGDISELRDLVRNYLLSVDFREIDHEVAGRICDVLDIRADALVTILTQLAVEGLLSNFGTNFVINRKDTNKIEVTQGQVSALVEAILCPICRAPVTKIVQVTKCDYCGSNLKLNL